MTWEQRQVLSDVDLTVDSGDFIAITGPNGGGKTTLLRIILKLLKPSTGRVVYYSDGQPVDTLPIGYLPQKNMIDSRFPITVGEVVSSGLLAKKEMTHAKEDRLVDATLSLVDLVDHRDASIGKLSGGQLQRALLGRALVSSPEILVLDEPLSYLDKQFEARIYDIIAAVAPTTTIILVSHEMSRIAAMANRHVIVNHTLHFCGAAHHYFSSPCPPNCDDAPRSAPLDISFWRK